MTVSTGFWITFTTGSSTTFIGTSTGFSTTFLTTSTGFSTISNDFSSTSTIGSTISRCGVFERDRLRSRTSTVVSTGAGGGGAWIVSWIFFQILLKESWPNHLWMKQRNLRLEF